MRESDQGRRAPLQAPTQSPELELVALEPEPPESELLESVVDLVDWPSLEGLDFASLSVVLFAFEAGLLDLSFLAQPEPLKTIAGVDNSLRISAPQRSQFAGPGSLTPCITSVMCPFSQM
jgi:hypothetical protein